jgi:hypothetical protein
MSLSQTIAGSSWIDARYMQDFRGIEIADASNPFLIE